MALLLFNRVRIKLPGVSVDIQSGEQAQFAEAVDSTDVVKFGYYVQNIFEMKNSSGAFTTRERGLFGVHFINNTSGSLDTTWTTADFLAGETAMQSVWAAMTSYMPSDFRLVEHRWYAFGPGVVKPNPPVRITTIGSPVAGSSGTGSPHQLASTVTLRTPLRRHWGRVYLPLAAGALSTGGQLSSTTVDSISAGVRSAFTTAESSAGISPVVYDRARKLALSVTALEVDSNPDIIRRRRPRDTGYKKIFTS